MKQRRPDKEPFSELFVGMHNALLICFVFYIFVALIMWVMA